MHLCRLYMAYTNPTKKTGSAASSTDDPEMPLCAQQVSSLAPRRPDLLTTFCSQTPNTMGTPHRVLTPPLQQHKALSLTGPLDLQSSLLIPTLFLLKPEAYNGKHSNIFFLSRKAFIATEMHSGLRNPEVFLLHGKGTFNRWVWRVVWGLLDLI